MLLAISLGKIKVKTYLVSFEEKIMQRAKYSYSIKNTKISVPSFKTQSNTFYYILKPLMTNLYSNVIIDTRFFIIVYFTAE